MYKIFWLFSSPCHRQRNLLPSLGVRRPLTFHILIFSSETSHANELKLGRKHRYGRSSIKIAHFVPICLQTWPPQAILVSDWLISKKSSPLKLIGQMNQNLVKSILYKDCSFSTDPLTNVATTDNSCFSLVDF